MSKTFFFAYASNLNKREMTKNCPDAGLVGYGLIKGFTLSFNGFDGHAIATIIKSKDEFLPVAMWDLDEEVTYKIDNYERFPYLYERQKVTAIIDGIKYKGDIFVPKQNLPLGSPAPEYLSILREGYQDAGFDMFYIDRALEKSKNK